ncbi:MAG: hypothetical protein WDO73_22950 [Ignavibacteriota bacterium]
MSALAGRLDYTRIVEIALRNQEGGAAELFRLRMKRVGQFAQNMPRAEVEDAVDGIQAQGVDMVFGEPVESVLHEEAPHARRCPGHRS